MEITATDDQAGTADELPCADSIGGIVRKALIQKVGEAVELTIGLAVALRELICKNRGDEITTNYDAAGTLDGLPCDGSVGVMVGEAISQKVDEADGLAVGLVDTLRELVCNN